MARRTFLPRIFRGIERPVRAHRRTLALAILAAAGGQLLALALPLLAREPIDALHAPASALRVPAWHWLALAAASLTIVRGALTWLEVYFGNRFAHAVLHDVRIELLRTLPSDPAAVGERSGAIVLRFIGDASGLQSWLARTCVLTPADVLTIFSIGLAIGWVHPPLLGVLLAALLVTGVLAMGFNRPVRRFTRAMRRQQSRLAAHIHSLLGVSRRHDSQPDAEADARTPARGDLPLPPGDGRFAAVRQAATDRIADIRTAALGRARREAAQQAIVAAGHTAALSATAVWGAALVGSQQLGIGDLTAILWLLVLARAPALRLARGNALHQRARVARRRIRRQLHAARALPRREAARPAQAPASSAGAATA